MKDTQGWQVPTTVGCGPGPHTCVWGGAASGTAAARACWGAAQSRPWVQASVCPQPMKVQSPPPDWQAKPTDWQTAMTDGQAPQVTTWVLMQGVMSVGQPTSVQAQVAAWVWQSAPRVRQGPAAVQAMPQVSRVQTALAT